MRAEPGEDGALCERRDALAAELGLGVEDSGAAMSLVVTRWRLELRVHEGIGGECDELAGGRAVVSDPGTRDTSSGAGRRLAQPLLRAVGIRRGERWRPEVIDATAGWGEDAWLLASAGCGVTAVERDPVVAALLEDGFRRASAGAARVGGRLRVVRADAVSYLAGHEADVVYLDPMFAPGRKTAERKRMRVLRWLVGEASAEQEAALLSAARGAARRRVVVKRPRRAGALAGVEPTATHAGRSVRYDVYAS